MDGGGGKLLERSDWWPMCGGLVDWRGYGGDGAWFLPPTEKVTESRNCMELGIACGGGSIGDGIGDGVKAVDNNVSWCDGRDGEVVMTEVDSVGDAEGLGFGINDAMAAVMLQGDANIESVRAAEIPCAASGWLVVGDDRAAKWEERGGIVVEGAIEVFPGGHAWCDNDGKEVGLEGLNGLLGSIAMMYVRRDELVPDLPLVHYGGLEFGADFIVKDLEINVVPTVGEVAHDGVVDGQSVFIGLT